MPGGIRAESLVERYGDVTALDGLDVAVPEGTVLGLLGPNGPTGRDSAFGPTRHVRGWCRAGASGGHTPRRS